MPESLEAIKSRVLENPDDAESLAELRQLYSDNDMWAELVELYEGLADKADDDERRERFLLEAGQLSDVHLEDPARAFELLAKARTLKRSSQPALALLELHKKQADWGRALTVLAEEEANQSEDKFRAAMMCERGRILKDELDNLDEAREAYERAWQLNRSKVALDGLVELYKKLEDWDALERIAKDALSEDEKSTWLRTQLARAVEERGDVEAAAKMFQGFLNKNARPEVLDQVESFCLRRGREDILVDVMRTRVEASKDREEKAVHYYALGQLLAKEGKVSSAGRAFKDARHCQPQNAELARNIAKALQECGDYAAAVEMLEGVIELEPENELALRRELAELLRVQLGRREEAIRQLERVIEREPTSDDVNLLATMYRAEGDTQSAARMKDKAYKLADNDRDRASRLREAADFYASELDDPVQAGFRYLKLLSYDPDMIEAAAFCDEHSREIEKRLFNLDAFEQIEALYRVRIGRARDRETLFRLHYKRANLCRDWLGWREQADESYQAILELKPDTPEVFDDVSTNYVRFRDFTKLVQVYELEIGSPKTKDSRRIHLMRKLATLYAEELDKPNRAAFWLEQLLELMPSNQWAWRTLEKICEESQDTRGLRKLYESTDAATHVDSSRDLSLRKARLEALDGDVAAALLIYRGLLRDDPSDRHAAEAEFRLLLKSERFEESVGSFRRLTEMGEGSKELTERALFLSDQVLKQTKDVPMARAVVRMALKIAPHNSDVHEKLVELDEQMQDWTALEDTLRAQSEISVNRKAQARVLLKLARVQRRYLNEPKRAADTLEKLLGLDPDNEKAADLLERLCDKLDDWVRLTRVLTLRVEALPPGKARAQQHCRIARVMEERLADPEGAAREYRQALGEDPENAEAFANLPRIYAERGDWKALEEEYSRRIARPRAKSELVPDLLKLGDLYHRRLHDRDRAADCYRAVLAVEPGHVECLDFLTEYLREREYQLELAKVLEARLKAEPEPAQPIKLHQELAELYTTKAYDPERAVEHWNLVLSEEPSDKVRDHLQVLYRMSGRMRELADLYFDWAETGETTKKARLLGEGARVLAEELAEREEAVERYREALALDKKNSRIRRELAELLRRMGASEELDALYKDLDAKEMPEAEALEVLRERSVYLFERDPERACQALEEYLHHRPTDADAARSLASLYRKLGRYRHLWELLKQLLQAQSSPSAQQAVRLELGRIAFRDRSRLDEAIKLVKEVIYDDARGLPVLRMLAALYREAGNHKGELSCLKRQARIVSDQVQKLNLAVQIGELYEFKLNDMHKAMKIYETALARDSRNFGAIVAMQRVSEKLNFVDGVAVALEARRQLVDDPDTKRFLDLRLSEIYESNHQMEDAVAVLKRSLKIASGDALTLHRLGRLQATIGQHGEATGLLERAASLLEESGDQNQLIRVLELLATTHELLRQPKETVAVLGRVAELAQRTSRRVTERAALDNLLRQKLKPEEEARRAERRAELALAETDMVTAGRCLMRAGLAKKQLKDFDEAKALLRRALKTERAPAETAEQLAEVCSKTKDKEGWLEALEELAQRAPEVATRARALVAKAGVLRNLKDVDAAILTAQRAVVICPSAINGWQLLYRLAKTQDDLATQAHCLEKLAELSTVAKRVKIFKNLGAVYEQLNLPMREINAYARLLSIAPKNSEARKRLLKLYRREGRKRELLGLLDEEGARADDPRLKAALKLERASLLIELGREEDAVAELDKAVKLDPHNAEVHNKIAELARARHDDLRLAQVLKLQAEGSGEALGWLELVKVRQERLGDIFGAVEAAEKGMEVAEDKAEFYTRLSDLYQRTGSFRKLAELLGQRAELADEEAETAELLVRKGVIEREQLFDFVSAAASMQRSLELVPDNANALQHLREMLDALGHHVEFAEFLDGSLPKLEDERCWAWLKVARAALAKGESGPAREALEKARTAAPASPHIELFERSLGEGEERDWGSYAEALQAALEDAPESEKGSLARELGTVLLHRLDKPKPALKAIREALQHNLSEVDGMEAAEDCLLCLEKLEKWEPWFDAARQLADLKAAKDKRAAAVIYRRMGEQYERLKLSSKARGAFRKAVQHDPEDRVSLQRLLAAAVERGKVDQARAWLEYLAQVGTPVERASAHLELAKKPYVRDAEEERARLEAALHDNPELTEAGLGLIPIYMRESAWGKLFDVTDRLLGKLDWQAKQKAQILSFRAKAREARGDFAAAALDYEASVRSWPKRKVWAALAECSYKAERFEEVWPAASKALEAGLPDEGFALRLLSAESEQRSGRPESAVELYRQILEEEPGHELAGSKLFALADHLPDAGSVLELFQQLAKGSTGDDAVARYLQAGRVAAVAGKDSEAEELFLAASNLANDDPQPLQELAKLYRGRQAWELALGYLQELLTLELDSEQRAVVHFQIGEIYRDGLDDLGAALRGFESVLNEGPSSVETLALQAVEQLLEEDLESLEGFVARPQAQRDARAELLGRLRLGQLYLRVGKRAEALAEYERILQIEEVNEHALATIAQVCFEVGDLSRAAASHRRMVQQNPLRTESYRALMRIFSLRKQARPAQSAKETYTLLVGDKRARREALGVYSDASLSASPRPVDKSLRERYFYELPEAHQRLDRCLALAAPALFKSLEKMYRPSDLKGRKLKSRGRIWEHVQEVGHQLGLRDVGVYRMPEGAKLEIDILPGNPSHLFVTQEFLRDRTLPEARFLIARYVELLHGARALAALDDETLANLVNSLYLSFSRPLSTALLGDADSGDLKKLRWSFGSNKKQVEEAAAELAEVGAPSVLSWKDLVLRGCDRAALVIAEHIADAVRARISLNDQPAARELLESGDVEGALRTHPWAQALLSFFNSDAFDVIWRERR